MAFLRQLQVGLLAYKLYNIQYIMYMHNQWIMYPKSYFKENTRDFQGYFDFRLFFFSNRLILETNSHIRCNHCAAYHLSQPQSQENLSFQEEAACKKKWSSFTPYCYKSFDMYAQSVHGFLQLAPRKSEMYLSPFQGFHKLFFSYFFFLRR